MHIIKDGKRRRRPGGVFPRQEGEEAMKSLVLAAALGLGSLALVGITPAKADASWLSEALHRYYDPGYYGYYAPPVYDYGDYYAPSTSYYVEPGYVYPPTVYY